MFNKDVYYTWCFQQVKQSSRSGLRATGVTVECSQFMSSTFFFSSSHFKRQHSRHSCLRNRDTCSESLGCCWPIIWTLWLSLNFSSPTILPWCTQLQLWLHLRILTDNMREISLSDLRIWMFYWSINSLLKSLHSVPLPKYTNSDPVFQISIHVHLYHA